MTNVAGALAIMLAKVGVKTVFGYPGDPTIEFVERCREAGLDVISATREANAAFMAEAQAMLTGDLGVCLSTLGPGSTALVNGVAAANLDRVPVLAFSGQIETSRQATFTHQVVDHERMFGAVTKWAGRVEAKAVEVTMRKALRTAVAERPGAVHLSVASDVFATEVDDVDPTPPPMRPARLIPRVVSSTRDSDPVAALHAARRPLLLAGIGAVRSGATTELLRLADVVGMPVVVSPMAKGVVPEDSEWFAGILDMACNATVWQLVAESDLVVAAGFDAVELIKPWRVTAPVLHIDAVENTDQIYVSAHEVVGDVAAVVGWLADSFHGEARWTQAELAAYRAGLTAAYYAGRVAGALNPTDVIDVVQQNTVADAVVSTDVGSHKLLVGQGWRATRPRGVLMTNGLSSMGFGLPAAVAAKMSRPDSPVVSMIGDGGFAMSASELRLAADRGLGIVVVVLADQSLNRIEIKQTALGYPSVGTRVPDTAVAKVAEAYDCHGVRVETSAQLERVLADVGSLDRPLVVEARIDPAQYTSQF
ncbi:thiamine pyrophosphate-binding protein [Monashia sp. NPDC004114]